jgi:signal transduction histidine kinase
MRRDNIAIILPLQTEHQLKGAVLLGDKQSGDLYTKQDIQVLEILGPELAVAIENAHSYQQVQEFNKTLQENIDKATQQLKSANEQLSRKNHQLEQLDKLKDEFISVTSHELRTPLTAIRGYLWMVMNNRKDASTKLYLDRAYISSERLIALVNDTLDISRIESGRVQLNPEPTKLPALAKLVAQELEPRAVERHQQLIVKQDSHLPAVDCDADKIHQVLTNLVGNALKFTPEKGKITVHFYTDKHMVVAAVSDTGPGVSPADQKKLFQKFSRLESTIGVPGTGLGLYLCQQIIELSKGKIWMDSQVGQGSTFFFSLPISKQQPSILPVPRQSFNKVA